MRERPRLALDLRELSVGQAGGLRSYAESLLWCAGGLTGDFDPRIYLDREPAEPESIPQGVGVSVCGPTQMPIREQFTLPRALRHYRPALVHFPGNTAPVLCPTPYVLTLHDTFCMQRKYSEIAARGNLHGKLLSLYSKVVPFHAARRAAAVVTVSEYSARSISALLKMDPTRVRVIHQAISPRYRRLDRSAVRESLLSELGVSRLVFVIGSTEPRKNVRSALAAYGQLARRDSSVGLVMTWPMGEDFRQWAAAHLGEVPERIYLQTAASDEDVVAFYNAADVFVLASLREGFGLPVIEAMACGCPVVAGSVTAVPDTAGGAAMLVNPLDADAMADAVGALLDDSDLRESLVQKGLVRASEFGLERAELALKQLYLDCIERRIGDK